MEKRLIVILIFILLLSCDKHRNVVVIRDLEPFSGLFVNSSFDIQIHPDTSFRIMLSGSSDIVDEIEVSMLADTLIIENHFSAKWLRPTDHPIKVDLYCDSLERIVLNESCNLRSSGPIHSDEVGLIAVSRLNIVDLEFDANTVFYWNNFPCNGSIVFRGETQNLKIWNTALMRVDASELNSSYVLVENDSGVECKVIANDILDYSITGAGNIIVSGNPEIISAGELSGSGQLILID